MTFSISKKLVVAAIIFGCLSMTTFSAGAVAEDKANTAYAMTANEIDLRGHSEPLLVVFGTHVQFKHYLLVNLLSQFMAVATDAHESVRYELRETGEGRELVIN